MSCFRSLFCLVGFATLSSAPSVAAAEPEGVVEEVVVTASRHCGAWPVAHAGGSDCEYAELKAEVVPALLHQRPGMIDVCLVCSREERRCSPRSLPRQQKETQQLCRSLFSTPIRVTTMFATSSMARKFLDASISFDISVEGRVENIVIHDLEGWNQRQARELIRDGARRVRFEPLLVDGVTFAITNLEAHYTLSD